MTAATCSTVTDRQRCPPPVVL